MALMNRILRFPRIRDNGDGTVSFRLGKIAWSESNDETLLEIGSREEAVKLHARMWCIRNGYRTWADLLADPAGLAAYYDRNEQMRVDE